MKLVAKGAKGGWELYNIAKDRSEQNDLSDQRPKLVEKLSTMWQRYAERADVLPLNPNSKKKKEVSSGRKQK